MFSSISNFWNLLSKTGTGYARSEREKADIILLNRSWFVLMLTQVACLVSHIINHLERSAFMTAVFIVGLMAIHFCIRSGKIDAAKIMAIAIINVNTVMMGIFFGLHSHIIDFLLLTALLPLYFFEIKQRRLIFCGIAISVIPFAVYHLIVPYLAQYALPENEQTMMFNATIWEKVFCLIILLYLMYNKNLNFEKQVEAKEAELSGQKKLYELMLEQIPIDIVTFDKNLRYTYINSTAVNDPKMREWIIGKTNEDYFRERNLDMSIARQRDKMLKEALEWGKPVEIEESIIDRTGKRRYSIKGSTPLYNEDKSELLCLIGYSLDITAIKEAESKLKEYSIELERKNEDLHHFVNATSHDLKSPLRNIASYLQLIERKNAGKLDDDSLSMIAYTIKSVKHLNQLINDIYHYSVADSNEKPVEITDLGNVLGKILVEMESTISEKKAQITIGNLPVIKAAPSHIGLVFSNLLGNAIKYNSSEIPGVNIEAATTDTEYIISVTDNGIGIPEQYNKQIFEIFQRLHTSEEYEGTGVGLAICSKIIDNYGGRIWVEPAPGKGSTFHFTLSREIADPDWESNHKIKPYNKFAIAS